jgi:hypothetical protein
MHRHGLFWLLVLACAVIAMTLVVFLIAAVRVAVR